MPKFDVFLSHSSVDKAWVSKLKEDLLHYGVSVWLDKDEVRPGDLFAEVLEQALDNCWAVALVVSPEAINSGWVKEEYYRALSLTKTKPARVQLIPVILRDAELPGFLKDRNWVDFRDESAYAQNVWKLVWGITGQKPDQVFGLSKPDLTVSTSARLLNPFIVGPPVDPEHFIGRKREVHTILGRLTNPGNRGASAISGERRIGKTSLLHYVESDQALASRANLSPNRAKFLYLNGHLIVPLVAEQFWTSIFSILSGCQELEGNLRVLAQSMSQEVPSKDSLVDFFCKVGEAGCLVVALFDEFDPVMDYTDPANPEFFYTLRTLLNQPSPRGFSLVTASRDPLSVLFQDVKWRGSEFYNNMAQLPLPPFTRSEMDQLLDTYLEDSGIQFDNRLRNFLFEVSEGYPQAIQHGASILFDDIVRAEKEARRWRFSRKMRDDISTAVAIGRPRLKDEAKGKSTLPYGGNAMPIDERKLIMLESRVDALKEGLTEIETKHGLAQIDMTEYLQLKTGYRTQYKMTLSELESLLHEAGIAEMDGVFKKVKEERPEEEVRAELKEVAETAKQKGWGEHLLEQINAHKGEIASLVVSAAVQIARTASGLL